MPAERSPHMYAMKNQLGYDPWVDEGKIPVRKKERQKYTDQRVRKTEIYR